MIAQHCRDGVEFIEIGRLVERTRNIKWEEHVEKQFAYIDLSSVDRNTNAITDTEVIVRDSAPSRAQQLVQTGDVLFGTTRPTLKRYCIVTEDYDGQIASTGFCVLRPGERITSEWLFYLLGTSEFYEYVESNQRGSNYPGIPDELVKKFKVPVPPVTIQREIALTLDEMTHLTADLAAELVSERESRSRQYAHYRNSLLTFGEVEGGRWVSLGETASVGVGQAPPAGVLADDGDYLFVNAGTSASGRAEQFNTPGETVTVPSRGQGGVGIAGYQSDPFWCGPLCYRIRSRSEDLETRFLYHWMKARQTEIRSLQQTGGTPALNRKELVLLQVPIPPLEEQQRIIAVLDQLGPLLDELSSELSAEITARRKQYEYNRDQVMMFSEAVA